jgi:hypothetical protein
MEQKDRNITFTEYTLHNNSLQIQSWRCMSSGKSHLKLKVSSESNPFKRFYDEMRIKTKKDIHTYACAQV